MPNVMAALPHWLNSHNLTYLLLGNVAYEKLYLTISLHGKQGAGLLWRYGLLRCGYILLCHTKVINRHVTESEDMLLLFRQLYNAYP